MFKNYFPIETLLFIVLISKTISPKEIFVSNENPLEGNGTQINPYKNLINGLNISQNEENLSIIILSNSYEYNIDEMVEIISMNLKIICLSPYATLKFQKDGYFYVDGNSSLVFENISFKIKENFSFSIAILIKNCFRLALNVNPIIYMFLFLFYIELRI